MPRVEQILAEGQRWLGTPFQRGQRLPGIAGDCCAILWTCYLQTYHTEPWTPYGHPPPPFQALFTGEWEWHTQEELLLTALRTSFPALQEVAPAAAQPGDFLICGAPGQPANHIALLYPGDVLLHARLDRRRATGGASIGLERRHAALRKTERTALAFPREDPDAHP